jgi:hypothetical protein
MNDEPDSRLNRYDTLVGEWEIILPPSRHLKEELRGRTSYEWLSGKRFLIQRSTSPDPFPDGISVIGADEQDDGLAMYYFDSRGVSRLCRTSFEDGVLKIWRKANGPDDFAQRFEGVLSDDKNTITARWDIKETAKSWQKDFDGRYERI